MKRNAFVLNFNLNFIKITIIDKQFVLESAIKPSNTQLIQTILKMSSPTLPINTVKTLNTDLFTGSAR